MRPTTHAAPPPCSASTDNGVVEPPGIADFSPVRSVTPGPAGNEFVGGTYAPGSVGDAAYSPLITTGNRIVLTASQVAHDSGVHDPCSAWTSRTGR